MPWSRYILGYHGCDAEVARSITSGKEDLKPSQNKYDWLGHGAYFWEDGYDRALRWAKEQTERSGSKIKKPAVLGAIIDLGSCLDLIQVEFLDLVSDAHNRMLELFDEIEQSPPVNSGPEMRLRNLDCAVFQALHEFRALEKKAPFDTVRAFFVEGTPLCPSSGIRQLDHIQICVRNKKSIVGYFLPRK